MNLPTFIKRFFSPPEMFHDHCKFCGSDFSVPKSWLPMPTLHACPPCCNRMLDLAEQTPPRSRRTSPEEMLRKLFGGK